MMKKIVFALIASAAIAGAAQAQDLSATAPRGYVGLGVATADHDYSLSGVTTTGSDGYKASPKIFGGYEFNNIWGVEAGYTHFSKSDFDYTTAGGVTGRGGSRAHALYVAGKANAMINDQFSVFGKLGLENSDRSFSTSTPGLSGSDHNTGVYAGVGVQYNLNKQVALTAEYERYGKSTDFGVKPDVWTVGARYNF
jgi:OOP family OmpA-OmpF porin